jgi:L-lactate dehydrogenase complex protein LldG
VTSRDSIIHHIRQAVAAGNRSSVRIPHPARGDVGYQGAGADPVRRFCDEFTTAGGVAHLVADSGGALAKVLDLVQTSNARRVLLGCGRFIDSLGIAERLRSIGLEVYPPDATRDALFAADVGITGVDALVAETGSIVQASYPGQSRSLSLVPPVHIAVAERAQIVSDLFDWFESFPVSQRASGLPACLSLITGPSKTGDIELKLVTGVHGPGEVHVVLVDS